MAYLSIPPRLRFFDENGEPLSGGLLYTYEAGTTTPKATYTDESGATPNANPVVLDSEGYCDVWLDSGAFKFVLHKADDSFIWSKDDIKSIQKLVADQVNTEGALAVINNLSDLDDADEALTNLGLTATAEELNYTDGVTSSIQAQIDAKADTSSLTSHINDTSNPHSVTATQVGLGNVDNTSDADKPVSTAAQSALDLKFDSADVIDEDDMASDSATKVPTQQSVKAYVDENSGGGGAVPVGTVLEMAVDTTPGGFLYCDGSAVSRTLYANLFAAIGTAFGEGDGSTTFNIPDKRGMFSRGVDDGAGIDPDAATRTAANTGGNTGDNIGSEQGDATARPGTNFTTNTTGNHSHSITVRLGRSSGTADNTIHQGTGGTWNTNSAGNHSHSITGGGDNETRPKNLYFKYYIKY